MMGVAGLIVSLAFTAALIPLMRGMGGHRSLLLIPAMDMLVGSNVEGILTFNSWCAIAILVVL